MDKIRISNGKKRIEVNDAGEYIEFSISDPKFMEEYADMMEYLDKQKEIINKMKEEIISVDDDEVAQKLKKRALQRADICREISVKIDNLFGKNASIKTFGTNTPDEYQIYEFFDAIVPYIEQSKTERQELINKKYNRDRKGAN